MLTPALCAFFCGSVGLVLNDRQDRQLCNPVGHVDHPSGGVKDAR